MKQNQNFEDNHCAILFPPMAITPRIVLVKSSNEDNSKLFASGYVCGKDGKVSPEDKHPILFKITDLSFKLFFVDVQFQSLSSRQKDDVLDQFISMGV